MRRGTTPTITATVDSDLTGLSIHLAFDAGTLIVKTDEDLDVSYDGDETTVSCTLTQEDTLSMKPGAVCDVQIRAFNNDGSLAMATSIGRLQVNDILEDGVLPHEN